MDIKPPVNIHWFSSNSLRQIVAIGAYTYLLSVGLTLHSHRVGDMADQLSQGALP